MWNECDSAKDHVINFNCDAFVMLISHCLGSNGHSIAISFHSSTFFMQLDLRATVTVARIENNNIVLFDFQLSTIEKITTFKRYAIEIVRFHLEN